MALGQLFGPGLVDIHNRRNFNRDPLDLAVAAQMKGGRETRTHNSDSYRRSHGSIILSG
jgi:hypothetical protein